jgi:hypothetical protein
MQIFNRQVFDETISGMGPWYTSRDLNAALGQADLLGVAVWVTDASGTDYLMIRVQVSADGKHWNDTETEQMQFTPESNAMQFADMETVLAFARLKISFNGPDTQCRLKVHVTGRVR